MFGIGVRADGGANAWWRGLLCAALLGATAHVARPSPVDAVAAADTTGPTARGSAPYYSSATTVDRFFYVSWSAADVSGIASYSVDVKDGDTGAWRPWQPATRSTRVRFAGVAGHTYWFRVRATDGVGNAGPWSEPDMATVPYDDLSARVRYRGSWRRTRSSVAFGRSTRASWKSGSSAALSFVGQRVAVVCSTGPSRGRVAVYLDGSKRPSRIVDTRSATRRARRTVYDHVFSRYGSHQITVKVLGTKGRARVDLDAIAVVRPDRIRPSKPSVTIGRWASHTRERVVDVALGSGDNIAVARMQISNSPTFRGAPWRGFARTLRWTLTAGDGPKRVYVRVRDAAGNVSAASSDGIVLDTVAPRLGGASQSATIAVGETRPSLITARDTAAVRGRIVWTEPGESGETSTAMTTLDTGELTGEIPPHDAGVRLLYRFVVRDAAGNESTWGGGETGPALGWEDASNLPTAPAGFSAVAGDRNVALSWSRSLGASEVCEVWRSTSSEFGPWTRVASTRESAYTDSTVRNARRYHYAVAVRDGALHGARSAPASAEPQAFSGQADIPLDTSATGWDLSKDVSDAVIPVKLPAAALRGCEKTDFSDVAFYDEAGVPVDCSARIVVRNAGTRAVAYQMSNKILTHRDGDTEWRYLTYSKAGQLEGLPRPSGAGAIAKYDRTTGRYEERVFDPETTDNHGGYSLWFDSEGRINAVGGAHNAPTKHYRSHTPYGIDLELVDPNVSDTRGGVGWPRTFGLSTYPSFVPGSSGSAYGVLRMLGTLEMPGYSVAWHYFNGARWERPVTIAEILSPKGKNQSPTYDNFVIEASDGVAYAFAHRFEVVPAYRGISPFVMCTSDPETATPTFVTADSARTQIKLPANQSTMTKLGSYSIADDTRLLRIGRDDQGGVYAGVLSIDGARAGKLDIYRVKAGAAPRRMGTLNTNLADPQLVGRASAVAMTVVGSRMVAVYDGTVFGTRKTGGLYMATSEDWGASWSSFVRVTPPTGAPSWSPALPMQDAGGEQPSWPLPLAYQIGGSTAEGGTTAEFVELSAEGTRTPLLSPGMEVWALLRGLDVRAADADQHITVKFGDPSLDPPEDPDADDELRLLHAFTDTTFGPFRDRSAAHADLTESGRVYKTLGAYSGIGWAADLAGSSSAYISGRSAALDPGTADMTFVTMVRLKAPSSGVLVDASGPDAGFDVGLGEDGRWRLTAPSTGPGVQPVLTAEEPAGVGQDGAFHMVGFTRSGNQATAFVDGLARGWASGFGGVTLTSDSPTFTIGRSALDADIGLTGMWVGRAWTPAQMKLFYAAVSAPQMVAPTP